ncbi:MAG: Lysophospholipase L2 [Candidatus Celerinatantimonas neptuna]|nr:MAG: Lysophospholipase L2 [Candidatus Celerinatantimonas neptuna]
MDQLTLPEPFTHYSWFDGQQGHKVFYCHSTPNASSTSLIVLSIGRAESAIKYTALANHWVKNGFTVIACDHRGQGFSQRLDKNPLLGHIERFDYYISDLKCLFEKFNAPHYSKRYLLGHSMGGAIATLYLNQYPDDFSAAIVTAPMYGIALEHISQWRAKFLTSIFNWRDQLIRKAHFAAGQGTFNWPPFEKNRLTHSQENYQTLWELYQKYPQLQLAGPSFQWLSQSFKAMKQIARLPRLNTPLHIISAGADTIVDVHAQRQFFNRQQQLGSTITFQNIPGAFHELLIEEDIYRTPTLQTMQTYLKHACSMA